MKKVYTILSILSLALLLVVGAHALLHLDGSKAEKPKLTFSTLMNGQYSAGRRAAYGAAFPKSDSLISLNKSLNGFYKFSAFAGKNDVSLIVDADNQVANGGSALDKPEPKPSQPTEQKPTDSSDVSSSSEEPSESTAPSSYVEPGVEEENLGAAILIGNRAVEVPYADYDVIDEYAAAVTSIADALGKDIRTFSIAVPNGAEFYTTEDYHSGSSSQINMIDYVYDHVGKNVITVDAYSKIAAHIDEYIYFRTDHHWTQLGAYYAYTAFCESAGFQAESLSKFEKGEISGFVGSMYNYLSNYPQAQILKDDPDTVYYYEPIVEAKARFYEDPTLDPEYVIGVISSVGSTSNKYLCFLGGDHPITIIRTDVKDGPTCMLLKESYGNAFAPWLTSHYSKIIVIDPREFNRDGKPSLDLAQFAKEQNVDDCLILNYPMMLSNESYITWLKRLVQ